MCGPVLMRCVYDWQQPLVQGLLTLPACELVMFCVIVFDWAEMGGLFTWIGSGCDCMHMLLIEGDHCVDEVSLWTG